MTNEQIKSNVNKMKATDKEKAALIKQCMAGNKNALFAVHCIAKRKGVINHEI